MTDEQRTILLVDDDDGTRGSMRRVLEKKGFHVLDASGPVEATDLARRNADDIDVVVLDVIMPGMSGISLADQLGEEMDDLRILYVSGYIEGELPEREESPGRNAFLHKPFTVDELVNGVRGLLEDGPGGDDDGD